MSHESNVCPAEINQGRRRVLLGLSWAGLSLYLATFLAALSRFIWPRVSIRTTMSVQVGFPDDYRPGEVVYYRGLKLFILRDEKGFLSFSAHCTHLGCMVSWNRDHHMFLCPCHGGKFDMEGRNMEGPPPRPLDAFTLRLDNNGYLVVDQDIVIKRGKGSVPRFRPEEI
jgi:cytochrome b6-f complex iron-sulfur subunit